MRHLQQQADANRFMEGGLFYPVGHIVAAFPKADDAKRAERTLIASGVSAAGIVAISAESMAREAQTNLDEALPFLSLGASLPVREKQLALARQGCHFLMIEADSDQEQRRVVAALSTVPVRYAVKYHRLTIENLVHDVPSATADREPARVP